VDLAQIRLCSALRVAREFICDWTPSEGDRVALAEGLSFSQLSITQAGTNALISVDGQVLARLRGVDATVLDAQTNFVTA
jgi:hypothetical protein